MLLATLLSLPLFAGLLCLITKRHWLLETFNIIACGISLILAILLAGEVLEYGVVQEWDSFLYADALSAFMVLLISIVSLSSSIFSVGYLRRDLTSAKLTESRFRHYYILTPLFVFAMFLVVLTNNLGIMWIALEGTALASVFLVALYNQKTSLEAAWKYIILGSIGLVLALFGTILTFAAAAQTGTETFTGLNWSYLMTIADKLDPNIMKLAFVFVLVGYGTKAGIVPMHTWLPDAHSEAPAPTSAMLSGVFLKVALYGLFRFHILTTHCLNSAFNQKLLLGFGLLSMCVVAPFVLVQTNVKRLFAYSSIEHVGIICVGVGLNTRWSLLGALLHMGYHALAKPVLFFASGKIQQKYHTLEISAIGSGLLQAMPASSFLLAIAVIAAVGIPPLGMFTSEFSILVGAMGSGHIITCCLFLIAIITVFSGFLNHITKLLLGPMTVPSTGYQPSVSSLAAMRLLTVLLILFSVWLPQPLFRLIDQASKIIYFVS